MKNIVLFYLFATIKYKINKHRKELNRCANTQNTEQKNNSREIKMDEKKSEFVR